MSDINAVLPYTPSTDVAMLKYTISDVISTMVVMSGLAIRAGSKPRRLAVSGSTQPRDLDIRTVHTRDMDTMKQTAREP